MLIICVLSSIRVSFARICSLGELFYEAGPFFTGQRKPKYARAQAQQRPLAEVKRDDLNKERASSTHSKINDSNGRPALA